MIALPRFNGFNLISSAELPQNFHVKNRTDKRLIKGEFQAESLVNVSTADGALLSRVPSRYWRGSRLCSRWHAGKSRQEETQQWQHCEGFTATMTRYRPPRKNTLLPKNVTKYRTDINVRNRVNILPCKQRFVQTVLTQNRLNFDLCSRTFKRKIKWHCARETN